jgi:tripartite-type tricarboxylate transporter receptor subunit TctC
MPASSRRLASRLNSDTTMPGRTKKLMMAFAAAAILVVAVSANAQDYPQQAIHIIVPFGPGGGSDLITRILAEAMERRLGKPVIVENRPGAGGIIGNEIVAKANPDGYTLGMMTAGQIIAAVTRKQVPYDTLALTPVAQVATASLLMLTRPDFPADNVKDVIALAKAEPGKYILASPGFAATQQFAGELFKQIAGIDMLDVAFGTTPEAINALLGRHADVLFETIGASLGQVRAGTLRAIAVTGKDRFPTVPDIPAVVESGLVPGFDVTTWYGIFGPPGLPASVVERLNQALMDAIADDKVRERVVTAGMVVKGSSAADFGAFMASEYRRWNEVREKAGIAQQ